MYWCRRQELSEQARTTYRDNFMVLFAISHVVYDTKYCEKRHHIRNQTIQRN